MCWVYYGMALTVFASSVSLNVIFRESISSLQYVAIIAENPKLNISKTALFYMHS